VIIRNGRGVATAVAAAVWVGVVVGGMGCFEDSSIHEAIVNAREKAGGGGGESIVYGDPVTYGGQTYNTVIIGSQTWMAENLNIETAESNCYDNNSANCAKYGRLYTWEAAKTACPSGWRLPSRADWDSLARAVGGTKTYTSESSDHDWYDAGKYLKSKTGWNSYSGIKNLDTYGFSALPGGFRNSEDYFYNAGDFGYWWTSEEYSDGYAYFRIMYYDYDRLNEYDDNKSHGYSVRCLRDL